IRTLRQYNGLAGYARQAESEYDPYGAAHASTSISAALGFVVARDQSKQGHHVVAVIGDGAMTGGLAFEGLNNAGSLKKNLLVILNDNTWSISKNVGAISKYLTNIISDERFNKLRKEIWELTGKFKRRDKIRQTISDIEDSVKGFLVPGMLFQKLGFNYFGPIDGHNLSTLIKTLQHLKNIGGPVMLHIGTVKGKGYAPAEADALSFHGVAQFDKITGKSSVKSSPYPAFTKVFGKTMVELGHKNEHVIAITAAMPTGTGLVDFAKEFPERFFDVGIAECHAGCFAAGLATEGKKPYLTIYSTFLQRAYDALIHDVGIQNLPVVVCMDRAGLVGNDGPTHHGMFDIAYLSVIPNFAVCAPKDGNELRSMLHWTCDNKIQGAIGIRYPRDNVPTEMSKDVKPIEWGTWEMLTDESDITVLTFGPMIYESFKARDILSQAGIDIAVVNARFIKPFDLKMLNQIRDNSKTIITIEEAQVRNGFGDSIGSYLLQSGWNGKFKSLGVEDRFITHGDREQLLAEVGLDAESIAKSISELVNGGRKSGSFFQRLRFLRSGESKKKVASGSDILITSKNE
ncbi:MAG TPA: 1-deoxy-D-xylulose-5-phosphate synthase, partial [candidate division Zixibacteria bacterium]|nr:1-deoxy-D-xylulose-5-phosphate synthase [candidate division Zixibacteria bacterium]